MIVLYTSSELLKITDLTEKLATDIRNSDISKRYFDNKQALTNCTDAQELIRKFNKNKDKYDEAMRFGKYYPDYDLIIKETLTSKREMDMHPIVINYKKSENDFLEMLTEVSKIISSSVSDEIIVPSLVPLSNIKSCNCGSSGGACGCS